MPLIGQFTRTPTGFSGGIRTLSFDTEFVIVPTEPSDAENAPDYRIHLGDEGGPEVGAGWKRGGEVRDAMQGHAPSTWHPKVAPAATASASCSSVI